MRFTPFPPQFWLHKSYEEWAEEGVRRVAAVREAVGHSVDICVEIHRQMNPAESIWLGRRLEQFHPYFYEDPMLPDSPAIMGDVQDHCDLPMIAGLDGELYFYGKIFGFEPAGSIEPLKIENL